MCVAWLKGLKRVWSHPARTHSTLVAPVCRPLPLSVELTYRFARFITKCLNSANSVIKPDAKQSIYFNRLLVPIGRNSQQCIFVFSVSVTKVNRTDKKTAWTLYKHV